MKKKCLFIGSLMVLTPFIYSCASNYSKSDLSNTVSGLTISDANLTLEVGERYSLSYSVLPSNATNQNVTWATSNESICSISNYGVIKALEIGSTTITGTTEDGGYTATCDVTVIEKQEKEYVTTLNGSNVSSVNYGAYLDNFGTSYIDGNQYAFYRAGYRNNGEIFTICEPLKNLDNNGLSGSFSNVTSIDGIKQISIIYKSDSKIKIRHGANKNKADSSFLPPTVGFENHTLYLNEKANYFSIETNGSDIAFEEIKIIYDKSFIKDDSETYPIEEGKRLVPSRYEGELISGVTTAEAPVEIAVDDEECSIISTKSYTYYSFEDVAAGNYTQTELDDIVQETSSIADICNYFNLFHSVPVYYGGYVERELSVGDLDSVVELFKENARKISEYDRNSGYVTSIPYRNYNGSNLPLYWELDIDINNQYSVDNRGAGRIVIFNSGFKCYEENPVCLYTDDHYVTFSEYMNYGNVWSERFDTLEKRSTEARTNRCYTSANTLTIK